MNSKYVNNIIKRYNEANTSLGAPKVCRGPEKVDLYASEYVEAQRLMKLSIYASEIRQRLLLDGVLHLNDLPSNSQINKLSRYEHVMTRKKTFVIPRESTTTEVTDRTDDYLNEISTFHPTQMHFFDETGLIKISGNRTYGSAPVGLPSLEVPRYASNANYKVNLMHSITGVTFFNILDGPSNGMELLNFFDEALQLEREDGSAFLNVGIVSLWIPVVFTMLDLLNLFCGACLGTAGSDSFISLRIRQISIRVKCVSTKSRAFCNVTNC